jgi:hypothetical protein
MAQAHYMLKTKVWLGASVLVLAGCAASPRVAYQDPWASTGPATYQPQGRAAPALQPAGAYQVPTYEVPALQPAVAAPAAPTPEDEAAVMRMRERLERVERAMLRLDRRMQLVEKNELSRMNGAEQTSSIEGGETAAMLSGAMPVADDFRQVAVQGITSTLQAAPRMVQVAATAAAPAGNAGLPSLADKAPAAGRAPQEAMSIWTVRYQDGKTWPEREQLPSARDVVDSLRGTSVVTVFARGAKPQSVEFRDRVKALSRYLAKVSGQETVAISALDAPHLDGDTIEIFATH